MDKRSHSLYIAVLLLICMAATSFSAPEIDPYFRQWLPSLLDMSVTNKFGNVVMMTGRDRFADFELSAPGNWTFAQIESRQDLGGFWYFVTWSMFETGGLIASWGDFE